MKKSTLFTIFAASVIACGVVGAGFGAYFGVSYLRREINHRFEAAYIYDTTFTSSVDVDLGVLYPGTTKEQEITVKSLILRDVAVKMTFSGEPTNLANYLCVRYNDEDTVYLLKDILVNRQTFTFRLKEGGSMKAKFTYYINDEYTVGIREEQNFSINIKADEISIYDEVFE